MDGLILKIVESLGIPGIIVTLLYALPKLVRIIRSSEIERLFFSHEKKFIYRVYLWIGLYFAISILMTSLSILNITYFFKFDFFIVTKLILYYIYVVVFVASIALFIFKSSKLAQWLLSKVNKNKLRSDVIFALLILFSIFIFSYICSDAIYNSTNPTVQKNQTLSIIVDSLFLSIFIPSIIIKIARQWIYSEGNVFSYKDDADVVWYLIKPLDKDNFIVGDNWDEDKCTKIRFASFDEIKTEVIMIEEKVYK